LRLLTSRARRPPSREGGVQHRVLGLDDRRVGEVDRESCVLLSAVGLALSLVQIVLFLLALDVRARTGDGVIPGSLHVRPPSRSPPLALLGQLAQILGLLLTHSPGVVPVRLKIRLGLLPRSRRSVLGFLRAARELAQVIGQNHFQPPWWLSRGE
jgi:hypothetical protein